MTGDERFALVEAAGLALVRAAEYGLGYKALARALELRYENLPPLFACDNIDESAGLADVVELNGYSQKAPCD